MRSHHSGPLWLALRLPVLPLTSQNIAMETDASVVVADQHTIVCANNAALQAGAHLGMAKVKAQMMVDEVLMRDKKKENNTLSDLAEIMYSFTPDIEFYYCAHSPQSGLLLDISRCLKLFKGSVNLINAVQHAIANTRHYCCYGLAHSGSAAWLLSYDRYLITGEETPPLFYERLKQIPITYLLDFPKESEALRKMGFITLGDILKQLAASSKAGLLKRFSSEFVDYISALFSLSSIAKQKKQYSKQDKTFTPSESFCDSIDFDYPIANCDVLLPSVDLLLENLSVYLRSRQLQIKKIQWRFYDIYNEVETIDIASDKVQSRLSFLRKLTLIKLASMALPFEVDTMELCCQETFALEGASDKLCFGDADTAVSNEDFDLILEKIKVNVGDNAIYKMAYCPSHVPECSLQKTKPSQQIKNEIALLPCRPTWLLPEPIKMCLYGQTLYWHGALRLVQGPERIEGCWWEKIVARDYYMAERQDHLRCWVFHDFDRGGWYLHGIF